MNTATNPLDNRDDMPAELDFGGGALSKFRKPGMGLDLLVHLETDAQTYLAEIAEIIAKKGMLSSDVANDLLKKEIAIPNPVN